MVLARLASRIGALMKLVLALVKVHPKNIGCDLGFDHLLHTTIRTAKKRHESHRRWPRQEWHKRVSKPSQIHRPGRRDSGFFHTGTRTSEEKGEDRRPRAHQTRCKS